MKPLKIHVFSDPGHAWARVPLSLLSSLGIIDKITPYSYVKGKNAYIEEDCDASTLVSALNAAGIDYVFSHSCSNNPSAIRNYPRFCAETIKAQSKIPHSGMVIQYGEHKYRLVETLGRRGWCVENGQGTRYRMSINTVMACPVVESPTHES